MNGSLIGIDYGKKRTGIAVSDETSGMTFPHAVWETNTELLQKVIDLATARSASGIVVGESRDLLGKLNPIAKDIERFTVALKERTDIPVLSEPEFMTSAQAAHDQGSVEKLDASAAAIILQSYLDKQKNKAVQEEKKKEEKISIDDVSKLDIRIGKITDARMMEGADKLLILSVDLGEERERTIISGIRAHFPDPSVLIGREVPVVANLAPRVMRGVASDGMILYVVGDQFVHTLEPSEKNIPPGTKVK